MSTCSSCHRTVWWVKVLPNKKRMPLDPHPVDDGNVVIVERAPDVVARVLTKEEPRFDDVSRYVSHFSTCPNAAEHRKKPKP